MLAPRLIGDHEGDCTGKGKLPLSSTGSGVERGKGWDMPVSMKREEGSIKGVILTCFRGFKKVHRCCSHNRFLPLLCRGAQVFENRSERVGKKWLKQKRKDDLVLWLKCRTGSHVSWVQLLLCYWVPVSH